MTPFKGEVERSGRETVSKHLKPGKRAMVKDFYANLGDIKNLTCYVRGRWVPFVERAISQILRLGSGGDCTEYEQLQKSPNLEEISRELIGGQGKWKITKTISNAFINRGDYRPSILSLNTCIYPMGVTLTHHSHMAPLGSF